MMGWYCLSASPSLPHTHIYIHFVYVGVLTWRGLCRATAWFQQDLPEYLTLPPELLEAEYAKVDDVVVRDLALVCVLPPLPLSSAPAHRQIGRESHRKGRGKRVLVHLCLCASVHRADPLSKI
jgi:hypothetical protein